MSLKLETPRLFIRSWTDDDLSHYLTLAKDEGYNCFSTPGQFPIEAEEAKKQIKARRQLFEFNGLGKFLVFEKETSELVGTCGLAPYVLEGHEEVELGYRLRLLSWGKGYATESAKKILEDGFKRIHLKRILLLQFRKILHLLKSLKN